MEVGHDGIVASNMPARPGRGSDHSRIARPIAHGAADHERRADQHRVLDDVLPLEAEAERSAGKADLGNDEQWHHQGTCSILM